MFHLSYKLFVVADFDEERSRIYRVKVERSMGAKIESSPRENDGKGLETDKGDRSRKA